MEKTTMARSFVVHLTLLTLIITLKCFHTTLAAEDKKVYIVYVGKKWHPDPEVISASHYDLLASILGSNENALASIVYSYKHGFSGFAAWLTKSQAQQIAELPEVISVTLNQIYHPQTTRSWDFIGLDYNKPTGLLKKANYGDGVIIGLLDTGIWPELASFSDEGYGPVPFRWKGSCQGGQNFTCNKKLIGARYYKDPALSESVYAANYVSARDAEGHGTHTASTAGGNAVANANFFGLANGTARGGAPHARLAMYKVCWVGGGCGSAPMLKAMDDAISDGVDVLSISIGGPFMEVPGALHAVAKGIVVVFSGGNDGPAPQTVGNPDPWVITVAASTVDRSFPTTITLGDNTKVVGQSMLYGAEHDFTEIFYMGSVLCNENSLSKENIVGMIVFCYAPSEVPFLTPRSDIDNAANAVINGKGVGLIYAEYTTNLINNFQFHILKYNFPVVVVNFMTADIIRQYYLSNTIPKAKLSLTRTMVGEKIPAPRVAAFSSRGPSHIYPGVLKPDIAAPGVSILAALSQFSETFTSVGLLYQFESGTSMACPHVSGIVALLKSIHPDWSPAAIKSALVTTASVVDGYGMAILAESTPRKIADPFDYGGGQVNPEKAVDPGLVYDISANDYMNFFYCSNGLGQRDNCSANTTDFYALNLPSISIHDLKTSVTILRTVTNVGPVKSVYKASFKAPPGVNMIVKPDTLKFDENAKNQTFNITFSAIHSIQGDFTFGSLTWFDGEHYARIPIVVRIIIEDLYADVS